MKVKECCAGCGKQARKVEIEIKEADKNKFFDFVDIATKAGIEGLIPPSRFAKVPIVIPAPGQHPCNLCKHGQETIGPSGCGRAKTCLAWQYFQIDKLAAATKTSTEAALKEFVCAAPNASWSLPTKKRTSARSVDMPFAEKPTSSSAPVASSKKHVSPKSKWRKS